MPDRPEAGDTRVVSSSLPLVQREVVLLIVLSGIAVLLFLATRSLADWSRQTNAAAAAAWFVRGESLVAAGQAEAGIAALRRAVVLERRRIDYVLALVRALTAAGSREEAWQLLQRLRADAPEHSEINARLAALAVERGDAADAARYYHHALFGLDEANGGAPAAATRAAILADLARLQLDQGDTDEALGTIASLARVAGDSAGARVTVGRLYARAGDQTRALASFAAAASAPDPPVEAHLGAADAAFQLGRFADADRHLRAARRAGATGDAVAARSTLVALVVAHDPLGPALPMTERVRRLVAGFDWAASRLSCGAAADEARAPLDAALAAARSRPRQELRDTEVIGEGVALIGRIRAATAASCQEADPLDAAWATIAAVRGASG